MMSPCLFPPLSSPSKKPQKRCRELGTVAQELRAQDLRVREAGRQLEASHLQTCAVADARDERNEGSMSM